MALKDMALFKLVSSAAKKTKEKIVDGIKINASENSGESVQETFKAVLKRDKDTSKSDVTKLDESENESKEAVKDKKAEAVVEKSTPAKKEKVTQTTTETSSTKKVKSAKKELTEKETPQAELKESAPVKKETAPKKATGTKREAKIKLYTADIQKHLGSVDEAFLAIVVKNLGPSIYKKDSELVSCSDPKELATVRNNFLVKKLGFDKGEKEMLDGEIQKVCETLKGTRTKYRATFYYALAKNLNKESALS